MQPQSHEGFLLFQFQFTELVKFIRQIHKTWKACSQRIYTYGEEFVGIDRIKEKIPMVAEELQKRIKNTWKSEFIIKNIRSGMDLPSEVINFPEVSKETLISFVLTDTPMVNAIKNIEGNEEIFIIVNHKRYTMKENGGIIIEKVVDARNSTKHQESNENEIRTSIF